MGVVQSLPAQREPAAARLPAEIWSRICLFPAPHKRSDKIQMLEEYIMDRKDMLHLRQTCKTICSNTEIAFGTYVFSSMKIIHTPRGMKDLLKISTDLRWNQYVKELRFGPERLHSIFGQKPGARWERRYGPRLVRYLAEQQRFLDSDEGITILMEVMKNLPNLKSIVIESDLHRHSRTHNSLARGQKVWASSLGEHLLPKNMTIHTSAALDNHHFSYHFAHYIMVFQSLLQSRGKKFELKLDVSMKELNYFVGGNKSGFSSKDAWKCITSLRVVDNEQRTFRWPTSEKLLNGLLDGAKESIKTLVLVDSNESWYYLRLPCTQLTKLDIHDAMVQNDVLRLGLLKSASTFMTVSLQKVYLTWSSGVDDDATDWIDTLYLMATGIPHLADVYLHDLTQDKNLSEVQSRKRSEIHQPYRARRSGLRGEISRHTQSSWESSGPDVALRLVKAVECKSFVERGGAGYGWCDILWFLKEGEDDDKCTEALATNHEPTFKESVFSALMNSGYSILCCLAFWLFSTYRYCHMWYYIWKNRLQDYWWS